MLINDYLYFPDNLKNHIYVESYSKLQNLFTIKSNSFQGKHELITTLFLFTAAFCL